MSRFGERVGGHIHVAHQRCPALSCKALKSYFIDPEACQACLICPRKCPSEAIDGGKGKIHVIDQDKCEGCGICWRYPRPPHGERRLPARQRAVPQPVGREHLRALPRHPRRLSVERAGRGRLLRTAIRCDDPVLFISWREHKHLYRQTYNKGEYPGADYMIPFGKAATKREGTDVVVATWGALVQRTLLAAQQAEKDGISTMVIDLRTIMPYDWDAIVDAVKKTSRIVIAHEDQITCGFGAGIAARVASDLFEHLDAPVRRVGAMDTPVAYCPDLEEVILPNSGDGLKAIKETAAY